MLRPLRTAFLGCLFVFFLFAAGCTTLYKPMYSPGKTNYRRPPEPKDSGAVLPPEDVNKLLPPIVPLEGGAAAPGANPPAPEAMPVVPGLPPP